MKISINQQLVPFIFQYKLHRIDPASLGYGSRVWLSDVSDAMLQYLKVMSMWGGPDKKEIINGVECESWEMAKEQLAAYLSENERRLRAEAKKQAIKKILDAARHAGLPFVQEDGFIKIEVPKESKDITPREIDLSV